MSAILEFAARNWALVSIATTLAILIIFPMVILGKYARIALNIMDEFAPPVLPNSREGGPVEGKAVAFDAFDGHALRGTILSASPDVSRKGMIIFAHEFGVDRWSCHEYCQPLRQAGYDVFTFDFRGHGESPAEQDYKPRQFASDREQADVLGAIALVEDWLERHGRPREVGLLGLSRGGSASLLAAVGIRSVKAIVVDGAFSSDRVMEYLLKRWASIFAKLRIAYENHPPTVWRLLRWVTIQKAQKAFCCSYPSVCKALKRLEAKPILFIHGERDSYIPVEQAQLIYNLAAEPKYLWTVPGARHNQSVMQQPLEYAKRVTRFFDRHLAGCNGDASLDRAVMSDLTQPLATSEQVAPPERTKHHVG